MFRGFLFDFDGTLVDSERESSEAMARVLERELGITVEQSDRDYVVGRSWVAIYEHVRGRYPQLTWTRDHMIARTAATREEVLAERGVTVLPGTHDILEWTHHKPRAIVTGSSRAEVMQILPTLGAHAGFGVIVAAEDVGKSKPAPDGYQMAMAALGLAPGECLVIEDSVAGIAAGRAAGCVVLAVRAGNFGGWDQSGAHHIIDSLVELTPALVDRLARDYGPGMGPR